MTESERPFLYTIGHSTRSIAEFLTLLDEYAIGQVVDVRTVPRSRHNPQFERTALAASLEDAGIGYMHMAGLGGLRHPLHDSLNRGWRNDSFRGFADYMQTDAFAAALEELIAAAARLATCIMCAEAVPWRCHRSLIADALVARGYRVTHIIGEGQTRPHVLNPMAVVTDGLVTYPAPSGAAVP